MSFIGVSRAWNALIDSLYAMEKIFEVQNAVAIESITRTWQDDVLDMVEEAGIDRELARKIIACESSWNSNAIHKNRDGTIDRGLWQINSIHRQSLEVVFNPIESTEWAIAKYKSGRGFTDWYCYTTGKYKRY